MNNFAREYLMCDRAVAVTAPYTQSNGLRPPIGISTVLYGRHHRRLCHKEWLAHTTDSCLYPPVGQDSLYEG